MLSYDVVEWGKPLQKAQKETPKPTGTEVLLKLKYCGVCHSDVHIRDGYFDLGGGKRFNMSDRGMNPPVTLGHEPFGTVVAAGPVGQDRLVCPWIGCGKCARCLEGMDNHCMAPRWIGIQRPGGYADHLLVPDAKYLVDASGIDPMWAATLSCSGLTTYSAVAQLKPIPRDEWVAVFGAGGLGLMAIEMLKALGHERIVVVDIDDKKLAAAKKEGAAATVNGRDPDAAKKLLEAAGGPLYGAVDLVGAADTATLALGALRKGGKLIVVGRNPGIAGPGGATRLAHPGIECGQRRRIEGSHRAGARGKDQADPDRETPALGSKPDARSVEGGQHRRARGRIYRLILPTELRSTFLSTEVRTTKARRTRSCTKKTVNGGRANVNCG